MVGAGLGTALGTELGTESWVAVLSKAVGAMNGSNAVVAIAVDANAGEANESSYALKLEVGDNKLERMHGTTQGTDINSGDNNKKLLLPKSIVEEDNLLSL